MIWSVATATCVAPSRSRSIIDTTTPRAARDLLAGGVGPAGHRVEMAEELVGAVDQVNAHEVVRRATQQRIARSCLAEASASAGVATRVAIPAIGVTGTSRRRHAERGETRHFGQVVGHAGGDLERRRVATARLGGAPGQLDQLGRRAARREEAVAEPTGAPRRRSEWPPTTIGTGRCTGSGPAVRAVEADELAMERRRIALPQLAHGRDVLVGATAAILERNAERVGTPPRASRRRCRGSRARPRGDRASRPAWR